MLTRDVAVLLPLRLETLFRSSGADWTMLLRIVPDEASVRRDDPVPTPTEIRLLTAMWQATYDALGPADRALAPADWLSRDLVPTAWESFCAAGRTGPGGLAGRDVPARGGGRHRHRGRRGHRPPVPAEPGRRLPETIEIWCRFAG